MPRLALFNMMLGFAVVALAAAAGAFIATETTASYVSDPASVHAWGALLRRAAHGHATLFGVLHVVFGLTLPYSPWTSRVKVAQTAGLAAGTAAMGILLVIRGETGVPVAGGLDALGLATGVGLAAALGAVTVHAAGLAARLLRPG